MSKITDTSYPAASALDDDDIVLVARDGIVERANKAAMQAWLFPAGSVTAWVQITQAAYNALSPPNPMTLYIIIN